ncbi:16S rRNA (cytidine(1402)-2'-O)-methyltransferase [Campylobacter suis]|uniref:Ribosomal RNA small subunit methyltransferase I n=1 Tax=Campylobacter suis TaxID=2790657 RepID=A0ABM8Q786_9BACT|nr:16S rRNA (cytidine(1402)-2'-O)-methyltransferase [Campylobacter suis]CAD7288657.1 Ribosomal RNA small subunit methyltransferase I [Campylobacter suis]
MIYFVPTPIGNLKDISLHALDVLRGCESIICEDTRLSKLLINLLNDRFDAGINIRNFYSLHTHNEQDFFANLDIKIFDKDVAFVSDAGMPGISDPGVSLVRYAQQNDIKYEVLSGSSASLLALVASGLVDKEFIFLGFLPNTGKERAQAIQNALNLAYPAIIYESPKRILALVESIEKFDENREIFLIKEATKKFETKFRASAKKMVEILSCANLNGEWCVVVNKSKNVSTETIGINDIKDLDIAPKIKAKLLAKISGESAKKIYENLISQKS